MLGECAEGGGISAQDRGVTENRIGSGRIRDGGSVQALVGHHTSFLCIPHPTPAKKCHHNPTATISRPPPQEPEKTVPKASTPVVKEAELALEVPSITGSQALEVAFPAHMAPLHLQLEGIERVYKCQVEGCSEGPSTPHATICAHVCRDHLGVSLACPSCTKTFLNSDALRHHKEIHSSWYVYFALSIKLLSLVSVEDCFVCLFVCKNCRSTEQLSFCVLSMSQVASCIFGL